MEQQLRNKMQYGKIPTNNDILTVKKYGGSKINSVFFVTFSLNQTQNFVLVRDKRNQTNGISKIYCGI